MTQQSRRFCTSCGTSLTAGTAFCTSCGAAAAPRAYAPVPPTAYAPASVPVPATGPSGQPPTGRRRGPAVLLVVLVVLVLAAGGAGAAWFVLGSEDEGTAVTATDAVAATTSPSPAPEDDASGTADASPSSDTTTENAEPTVSPSPVAAAPSVQCWDGTTAGRPVACGAPTAAAGLDWLFRGLNSNQCGAPVSNLARTIYYCADQPVTIHVSEWGSYTAGSSYYNDNLGGPPSQIGDTGRVEWFGVAPRAGTYKAAVMWQGKKWGVTVYAYTEAEVRSAIAALRMRPVSEYHGVTS